MTHRELVIRAGKWLANSRRCGVVLMEQQSRGPEFPDVIGWGTYDHSTVIECKVSRGDFLADKNKLCRKADDLALGTFRYYLVPKGMVREDELPEKWGLLEINDSDEGFYSERIFKTVDAQPYQRTVIAMQREVGMLVAALRKVKVGAFIMQDPSPPEQVLRLANEA